MLPDDALDVSVSLLPLLYPSHLFFIHYSDTATGLPIWHLSSLYPLPPTVHFCPDLSSLHLRRLLPPPPLSYTLCIHLIKLCTLTNACLIIGFNSILTCFLLKNPDNTNIDLSSQVQQHKTPTHTHPLSLYHAYARAHVDGLSPR